MNVDTKKMEFNVAIAVILAIFTGGIGLLIYVAIYLDREKRPRCLQCNSVCYPRTNAQPASNYQVVSTANQALNQKAIVLTQTVDEKPKFCYNCGTELNQHDSAKFCPLCGTGTT
jgi:hypothetical protein